jgi:hypothetical protein
MLVVAEVILWPDVGLVNLGSYLKRPPEGGKEMPPVFKALASITVWILFITGCITLVMTTLNWLVLVGFVGKPGADAFAGWGLGTVQLLSSVVAAKLRQMLE